MLVSRLYEHVLHQQPHVIKHAVPDPALVPGGELQGGGGGGGGVPTAALDGDGGGQRALVVVNLEQTAVEFRSVYVHAAWGGRGGEGGARHAWELRAMVKAPLQRCTRRVFYLG